MKRSQILLRPPLRMVIPPGKIDRRLIFPKPGSKAAAILADLKAGQMSGAQIARKFGCSGPNVSRIRRRAVERGLLDAGKDELVIVIGPWHSKESKAIHRAAIARGRHPDDLLRAVVRAVIADDLFDAILGAPEEEKAA